MAEELWKGVRERVSRLADRVGPAEVFGAGAHGFAVEPPLTGDAVEDAERALGVRLPEEYRGFLLEVGAGGAGPAYGVFALNQVAGGWEWAAKDTHRTDTDRLREPFTPQHIGGRAIEPLDLRAPHRYDFEYRGDYESAYGRWADAFWHPDRTAGAICVCDEGCLRRYWLVVTGAERGTIWRDYRTDGLDLAPLFDVDGGRLTFGRWYLAWLDEAERR
ncbi:hypothetical protein GCM10009682_59090 [Luedemannella flava]|uniref:Knr4/Smi1-like domain-containing protein n=1 Tax=Luedemannella flava TaxID=349316 RepID=A0ABP4YWW2_9ACTN